MPGLDKKTCVVTGAARGIGRAIATRFRDEDATVVVTDIDVVAGAATAADLECRFEPLDVGEEGDWERLAIRYPAISVLVNSSRRDPDGDVGADAGRWPEREARMRAIVADTPLRRFGTPEEVAALAVLLASDEAVYMTGAELTLDGGLLAGAAAAPG